jgi:hypothetical protein
MYKKRWWRGVIDELHFFWAVLTTRASYKLVRRAKRLAAGGYTAIYTREWVETGYCYALSFAELPAEYKIWHETLADARADEQDALVDFIYFMLLDGEPVPGAF